MKRFFDPPIPVVRTLIWNRRHEPMVSYDETNNTIDILHGKTHLTSVQLNKGSGIHCLQHIPSYAGSFTEKEIRNPLNHNHVVATYAEKYNMFIIRHEKKISCILLPTDSFFQISHRELT